MASRKSPMPSPLIDETRNRRISAPATRPSIAAFRIRSAVALSAAIGRETCLAFVTTVGGRSRTVLRDTDVALRARGHSVPLAGLRSTCCPRSAAFTRGGRANFSPSWAFLSGRSAWRRNGGHVSRSRTRDLGIRTTRTIAISFATRRSNIYYGCLERRRGARCVLWIFHILLAILQACVQSPRLSGRWPRRLSQKKGTFWLLRMTMTVERLCTEESDV